MTAGGPVTLKTAVATYAHTKALKDGTVTAPGIRFEHVEVNPIVAAFRRMVRTLEFDVSEMAITTYLTAKAHNKPFTALPIFVMRQFHHAPIAYNVKSGVKSPKDLEGKKVGVRAYTVTTGISENLTGLGGDRPNQVLADPYCHPKTVSCWVNPAAFSYPATGTTVTGSSAASRARVYRFSGTGRPRFPRSVLASYSARTSPRSRRM